MNHIDANCDSGNVSERTLTSSEIATIETTRNEHTAHDHAALMEQRAADAHDHAVIKAVASGKKQPDAAFAAAVARKLGIGLED